MPTSVASAVLLWAVVLAITGAATLAIVAATLAVAWEAWLFIRAGR